MPRNNVKYDKSEIFCQSCGSSLGTGYKVQKKKYCNNKCQHDYERDARIKAWLNTGVLAGHTGGKGGHTPRGAYVRDYILADQKYCCSICKEPMFWKGKPLNLILDHIDGDCTNNARGNLRMLCPNCDSQLDTFKNRNKGKGRKSRGFMDPGSYVAE